MSGSVNWLQSATFENNRTDKRRVAVQWTRNFYFQFHAKIFVTQGWDGAVGIASRYGLDGPGIESRWGGEIFRTRLDRPWGPPNLLHNGHRVFPWGKAAEAWR